MLAKDRHSEIIRMMKGNGGIIKMTDIINTFGVSHETARRDIETLQDSNYVKRIHGGAILNNKLGSIDFSIIDKEQMLGHDEREAIGKKVAEMVNEGESVLLANGSTVLQVARHLRQKENLTVITNSLPVVNELIDRGYDMFILGGKIDNSELNIAGSMAVKALQNIYVDKAIIGAGGVSLEFGISDYSLQDASLREEILRRASTVILAVHSEKFGHNAFSIGFPLTEVDVIVTDSGIPKETAAAIRDMGIEVVIAQV